MEQQDVVKYFTDVATHYDDFCGFTCDYQLEFVIKHLQLKPDDILADIGAGTGALSSLIWKKAGKEIKNRPGLDIGIRAVATQSTQFRPLRNKCLNQSDGLELDFVTLFEGI